MPIIIAGIFVAAVIVVLVVTGIGFLVDKYRERRRAKARDQYDVVLRQLFSALHPDNETEQDYADWFSEYDAQCRQKYGMGIYGVPLGMHKQYVASGTLPDFTPVKTGPNRWRAFWRHVGEFFVLIWMIALAKKWKICPLVELPTEEMGASS